MEGNNQRGTSGEEGRMGGTMPLPCPWHEFESSTNVLERRAGVPSGGVPALSPSPSKFYGHVIHHLSLPYGLSHGGGRHHEGLVRKKNF